MKNNVKKLTISGILLSVGFILHQLAPAGIGAVTFDYMTAILFIIIVINKDFQTSLVAGIAAGIIAALTTKFPGGQIPNIIDKVTAAVFVYFLMRVIDTLPQDIKMGIIGLLGTIVSGSVFLGSAAIIAGLPGTFSALFIGVVLPTAVSNIFVCALLYRVVTSSIKKVSPALLEQIQTQ
ncbi:MAG TPA: tryptophan transporter [Eubacteriaceae bacterium]|nr:tryptophan transporter [Eubacteriaceae bacterium]